jgi:hypothetical protein
MIDKFFIENILPKVEQWDRDSEPDTHWICNFTVPELRFVVKKKWKVSCYGNYIIRTFLDNLIYSTQTYNIGFTPDEETELLIKLTI